MGISELESFCSDLNFDVVSEVLLFPYLISFSADTGGKAQFSYVQYADPDPETSKVVFIAGAQAPIWELSSPVDNTESANLILSILPVTARRAAGVSPIVPRIICLRGLISKRDILAFCYRMESDRSFNGIPDEGRLYEE